MTHDFTWTWAFWLEKTCYFHKNTKCMLEMNALHLFLSLPLCALYVWAAGTTSNQIRSILFWSYSIQSICRITTNEEEMVLNAAVWKMIPKIVSLGYKSYEVVNKKWMATCKTCGSKISDNNFKLVQHQNCTKSSK